MTSEKVIEANKKNAQKCTGPKSPEGKATASKNSLAHGLTSKMAVLPDESAAEFEAFRAAMLEGLSPVGKVEDLLADRFTFCAWRLQRIIGIEQSVYLNGVNRTNDVFANIMDKYKHEASMGKVFSWLCSRDDLMAKLSKYETGIERSMYRALHELQRLQTMRLGGNVPPPMAIDIQVSGNEDCA